MHTNTEISIPIQTKVTNKYNTNDSSKQIDGRVTKTGREKKRRMGRIAREGRDQLAPSILYIRRHKYIPKCNNIS